MGYVTLDVSSACHAEMLESLCYGSTASGSKSLNQVILRRTRQLQTDRSGHLSDSPVSFVSICLRAGARGLRRSCFISRY